MTAEFASTQTERGANNALKILIISAGSRGDVQPYVALGKGLQTAGHSITVCTCQRFAAFVNAQGLQYAYMSNALLELLDRQIGRDAVEDTIGFWGTLKTLRRLKRDAMPIYREMLQNSWDAAREAEPDLLVFHPKAFAAASIAEKLGIPLVLTVLQPMFVPTREFVLPGLPRLPLGGWYNRLSFRLVDLGYRTWSGLVNEFREQVLNLRQLPKASGLNTDAGGNPLPILHAFSPSVVPRPADWPTSAAVTGYWFLAQSKDWTPPPGLEAFIDSGEAPVYIGFGSMVGRDPQRLTQIVLSALRQTGLRAVMATGWGGLAPIRLPETIFQIEQAPHDWLFPRMRAIVHHGGAGSTAAALLAGKPTLVCPFLLDQPFWGQRIHALGVGPKPLPQKKLSAAQLAAALETITTDPVMRSRAQTQGAQIAAENGVEQGVAAIEAIAGRCGLQASRV